MASDAVGFVTRAFSSAFDVFTQLIDKTGLLPFYMAMLAFLLIVVYFLSPFVKTASSDTVSRAYRSARKEYDKQKSSGKGG